MTELLSASELTKKFPLRWDRDSLLLLPFHWRKVSQKAVLFEEVSLTVSAGEILGLSGINGSGKSTLLSILAGIISPSTGRVIRNGAIAPLLSLGGLCYPDLSLEENVLVCGAFFGIPRSSAKERSEQILKAAHLIDKRGERFAVLSSGMQARFLLSLALSSEAKVPLIDELLSSLDDEHKEWCSSQLRSFANNGGAVILTSHHKDLLTKVSTRHLTLERDGLKG